MRIDIRNSRTVQPNQSTLARINLDRQGNQTEHRRRSEKDDTKQHQLWKRVQKQHTTQQYPHHNVRSKANDGHQGRTHPERSISGSVLHRVSTLMGSYSSGGDTVAIKNALAEVDSLVQRIVMVCQVSRRTSYLHVIDSIIVQHLLGDVAASHASRHRNLRILFKLLLQTRRY